MKKFLFALLFILIGLSLGAGAMFAVTKLNENQPTTVEDSNDDVVVEEITNDSNEIAKYAEGYYSVYSQKCGMSFPFPEASTFKYLEDLGAPAAVGDKNKGWYLSDNKLDGSYLSIDSEFDHQILISMTALPFTDHLGSGYTSANLIISCKEDAETSLVELMNKIEETIEDQSDESAFILSIEDRKDTKVDGQDAVSFRVTGGMGELEYTVTRNNTHIYMLSSFVGSPDTKIQEAAEYIFENVSI